jgi:hypothetical protein
VTACSNVCAVIVTIPLGLANVCGPKRWHVSNLYATTVVYVLTFNVVLLQNPIQIICNVPTMNYSNETTRPYIPEGSNFHIRRRENLETQNMTFYPCLCLCYFMSFIHIYSFLFSFSSPFPFASFSLSHLFPSLFYSVLFPLFVFLFNLTLLFIFFFIMCSESILLICKVQGSNLGSKTGYPDSLLVAFLSPSRQISRWNQILGQHRFLPNPLKFIIQLSSFVRRCIVCVSERASLSILQINKQLNRSSVPVSRCFHNFRTVSHLS